jgi:RHS repeat-associated protein
MREDGELTYLHTDHLGSASLSTDATGGVANEMRYYAYGGTRSGTMGTDRQYTGQRWEAGIGLYDYNARYYDPALGRFVQADTIVPSMESPQDLNRYSYVRGNPMRYIDPSGYDPLDADWEQQFRDANGRDPTDVDRQDRLYSLAYPGPVSGSTTWTREDWEYLYFNRDDVLGSTAYRSGLSDFRAAISRLAGWYVPGEEAQFVSGLALLYAGWPYDPSGENIVAVNFDGLTPNYQPIDPNTGCPDELNRRRYFVNHGMDGFSSQFYGLNSKGEPTENTHHYVGHMVLGYHWGATANFAASYAREIAQRGTDMAADIRMGLVGGYHGFALHHPSTDGFAFAYTIYNFSAMLAIDLGE